VQNILEAIRNHWVEIGAAVATLICVYLTIRNSIWNWFWGFVGVVLYAWVFWTQQLYANFWLQIVYYLPIQFWGWWVWLRFGPRRNDDLPVTTLSTGARWGWMGVTIALTLLFYRFLVHTPDPQPFADGVTTALCVVAQYLQVYKRFENWLLWLAADVIYAFYFFPVQKLYPSAVLYIILTVMAAMGTVEWLRILKMQRPLDLEDYPVRQE
jgi:nicotinamide mononucleotide transporter